MKNSILLFLLLFAFSFTKAQVPNQGLVYSYTFYKSFTNDGSASGHPSNNGSDFRKDRCFVDSGALTFDGINDYVRLDKMDSIDLGSFTMSVWFKSGSGKSRYESIMNMLNGGGDNTGFSFEINRGSGTSFKEGNLNFYLRDKTGKALSLVVVDPSANDCEWHHVCWVVDNSSTNTSRIYVDGTLRTPLPGYSAQSPSNYSKFQYDLLLGAANNRGSTQNFFKGSLDDLHFYNRSIAATEVHSLYTSTCPGNTYYDTTYITVQDTLKFTVNTNSVSNPNLVNMKVYPNPVGSQLTINIADYSQMNNYTLKIINTLGAEVYSQAVNSNTYTLNTSTLGSAGTYFLEVYDSSNRKRARKTIMIQ